MPAENKIGAGTPGLRPTRAITTISPAPARGLWGRACMVLPDGEGVPSPAPPRPLPGSYLHGPVHGMTPARNRIGAGPPGLRPSRAITTISPAPARELWGRAGMVLFGGEGAPSPAPPRVIPPRSGAWDDAGEEQDRGRHPGLAPHPGYLHDIPRSCAGARGKGLYGSLRRRGGSLPSPSPGDTSTVRCMG